MRKSHLGNKIYYNINTGKKKKKTVSENILNVIKSVKYFKLYNDNTPNINIILLNVFLDISFY